MKPLRLRPLQPGRAHIYRPPFVRRMLYVELLSADGCTHYKTPVWSLSEAFEVIAKKTADALTTEPDIDFRVLTAQRERREASNV